MVSAANTHLYMHLSLFGNRKENMPDAGTPLSHWIAEENSRRAIYIVLSKLIDMNRFDEAKAIDIARKIMRDNAIRVHNLD
jgi:hypothetical protein